MQIDSYDVQKKFTKKSEFNRRRTMRVTENDKSVSCEHRR